MKKIKFKRLLCSAFAVIFMSCFEEATAQEITNTDKQKLARINNSDKRSDCDSLEAYNPISPGEASKYISDFIIDPVCNDFGSSYGLAGFMHYDPSTNKLVPPYEGVLLFPCVWKRWLAKDRLFFSLKREVVCPGKTDPNVLISSSDSFVETSIWIPMLESTVSDSASVQNYLTSEFKVRKAGSIGRDIIDPKDVLVANFNYKELFSTNEDYSNYGFGFIPQRHFDSFVYQPGDFSGFCIFLGFTSTNTDEKVRMVLIGVDNLGNLMMHEDAICLEKSWPPIDPSKK